MKDFIDWYTSPIDPELEKTIFICWAISVVAGFVFIFYSSIIAWMIIIPAIIVSWGMARKVDKYGYKYPER